MSEIWCKIFNTFLGHCSFRVSWGCFFLNHPVEKNSSLDLVLLCSVCWMPCRVLWPLVRDIVLNHGACYSLCLDTELMRVGRSMLANNNNNHHHHIIIITLHYIRKLVA